MAGGNMLGNHDDDNDVMMTMIHVDQEVAQDDEGL